MSRPDIQSSLFADGQVAIADTDGKCFIFGVPVKPETDTLDRLPGRLQHLGICTTDMDRLIDFFTRTVGFRASDIVKNDDGAVSACFLRSDREHHDLALFAASSSRFDHQCYETTCWNDIRDWGDHFADQRTQIEWGAARHGAGNNLFIFVRDPDGNPVEMSTELETRDFESPPGEWKTEPRTLNLGRRMDAGLIDTDVVIVGAGPAGLATANYLGLAGVRAVIIERNSGTVDEPRAVSIDDESLRSMQTLGLVDQVVARTLPGYGSRYYSPGGREFARVKPTTMEFGYPRRSAFHQPELEAAMLRGQDRFPTIEVWFDHEFGSFYQDADGITVTVRTVDGEQKQLRGAFLAGCDGGRSSIRRAVGATLVGSSFEERWLVFDTVNDFDHTPDSVAYCDHRRSGHHSAWLREHTTLGIYRSSGRRRGQIPETGNHCRFAEPSHWRSADQGNQEGRIHVPGADCRSLAGRPRFPTG